MANLLGAPSRGPADPRMAMPSILCAAGLRLATSWVPAAGLLVQNAPGSPMGPGLLPLAGRPPAAAFV
eukprot:1832256-Alexandrium_andersonii.AAC.1